MCGWDMPEPSPLSSEKLKSPRIARNVTVWRVAAQNQEKGDARFEEINCALCSFDFNVEQTEYGPKK
jgi:hypothetical protein